MKELDKVIQTSFNETDRSLESMNQENYVLQDYYTKEIIEYGCPFIEFHRHIFASLENLSAWAVLEARNNSRYYRLQDDRYNMLWDKRKKTKKFTEKLTKLK